MQLSELDKYYTVTICCKTTTCNKYQVTQKERDHSDHNYLPTGLPYVVNLKEQNLTAQCE